MSIWLTILLSILPKLLEWLVSLLNKNQQVPAKQLARVNRVVWYTSQIATVAPGVGCVKGGVPPEDDEDDQL